MGTMRIAWCAMLRSTGIVALGICLFLPVCCNSPGLAPEDFTPILTRTNLTDMTVKLVDYNLAEVQHRLGSTLASLEVDVVRIGVVDSIGFHVLDSAMTMPDLITGRLLLTIPLYVRFDRALVAPTLRIRFHLLDNSSVNVDTVVHLFSYPYPSARVVVQAGEFATFPDWSGVPRDVAVSGQTLYIHPGDPLGLYTYDLISHQARRVFQYPAGDHIAADSVYVFCDVSHSRILRFNTVTETVDLELPSPGTTTIEGMATAGGLLYVRCDNGFMKRYTYGGELVDSLHLGIRGYFLAVANGVLMTSDYPDALLLRRYDLQSGAELASVRSPARETEGINVYRDTLYYCDFDKRIVGAIPMPDLLQSSR